MEIKTREGTYDEAIVKEVGKVYSHLDVANKTVLDIGGNIGASCVLFASKGASRVVTVEPDAENFSLLEANTTGLNVEAFHAAVVGTDDETVSLYLNDEGTNKAIHSTQPHRGRSVVKVPAINFLALLEEVKPEVIKIDCEGAEYEFLKQPLPEYVKQVVIELHLTKREWREVEANKIVKLFEGWICDREPKIEGKNWTTIASYRRPNIG